MSKPNLKLPNRTGKMPCPVCRGKGKIHEDANEYSFVTRDPDSHICLTCQGTGEVGPRKKLPDGSSAYEHGKQAGLRIPKPVINPSSAKAKERFFGGELGGKLNVSRKGQVGEEVTKGQGEEGLKKEEKREREAYESPMLLEMAINPRLNKVLAGEKQFLIVTETEPYYLDVYRMIREQERKQGTWSWEDEEAFVTALTCRLKELDSSLRWNEDTKKEAING